MTDPLIPLSVIQNIPNGDSCESGDSVCRYWAESDDSVGSYCVVQQTPLIDHEKTCGFNK